MVLQLFLMLIGTDLAYTQGLPSMGGGQMDGDTSAKNFRFVPIPYINYDRSLGFSIGAIPMAMYKVNPSDTVSPASISGLFGMYTSNESWFAMAFQMLFMKEDNWRFIGAAGLGSINFQFYLEAPVSSFINYNTQADFLFLQAQRRIHKRIYGGVNMIWMDFSTRFGDIEQRQEVSLTGIGLVATLDTRDNVYYPYKGVFSNINYTSFPFLLDNLQESNKVEFDLTQYNAVANKRDVLAVRAYMGLGIGDLTFQQQFIVGQTDIRGYTQGKYRGNYLLAGQGEYRWNFGKRMSAVGFLGLATVFESINENADGEILPGIGAGFRYNVIEEYHMNAGMDLAFGKDDWGIYFRIGEAF